MYKRTFKEYLIDLLNETTLFEMALSRSKAYDKIISLSIPIIKHLIKLKTLDLPDAKEHWISEIDIFLENYEKILLKPKNKKLSGKQIFQWFFIDGYEFNSSSVDNYIIKWQKYEYKDVKLLKYNSDMVIKDIKQILIFVFNDIGNNKFISIRNYL